MLLSQRSGTYNSIAIGFWATQLKGMVFFYPLPPAKSYHLHPGSMDFTNFPSGALGLFSVREVSKGNFVPFLQSGYSIPTGCTPVEAFFHLPSHRNFLVSAGEGL